MVLLSLVAIGPVQAAQDFSKMSTEQLYQMKDQVPVDEKANWSAEWQKRVVNMSPEELKRYNVPYSQKELDQAYKARQAPRQ
jgi:hypothetical protein